MTAGRRLARLGDDVQADNAALGRLFIPGGYFVKRALKNPLPEIVVGLNGEARRREEKRRKRVEG